MYWIIRLRVALHPYGLFLALIMSDNTKNLKLMFTDFATQALREHIGVCEVSVLVTPCLLWLRLPALVQPIALQHYALWEAAATKVWASFKAKVQRCAELLALGEIDEYRRGHTHQGLVLSASTCEEVQHYATCLLRAENSSPSAAAAIAFLASSSPSMCF